MDTFIEPKTRDETTVYHATSPDGLHGHRDNLELTRLGKKPVLKRRFGLLSILGFSCAVMITWEGVLLLFTINFSNGGLAGSVYGYLFVWAGTAATFVTMAELSSMSASEIDLFLMFLSFRCMIVGLQRLEGWLTMVGWQAAVASGLYLCATLISGLVILNNASYAPKPWQLLLIYWVAVSFAISMNTALSRLLPKVESFILVLHTAGFFAILIPLVYFAPHGSASDVFTLFLNEGNWPTQTLSFFVGIVGPVFSLLGADGAVHMSEEVKNPSLNVPRAIMFSVALNGCTGFGMLVAALFSLGDIDSILAIPTSYPFMAIFQQAVGSTAGALTMSSLIVIMDICGTISFVATASRMTWSFARDRGTPGWKYLSKVDPRTALPLASIAFTATTSILLSLISLGSSVAFNDVISLSINGLYASYLIGNGLLLWRRLVTTGSGSIKPHSTVHARDAALLLTNTIDGDLSWGAFRVPEPLGSVVNAFGCAYMVVVLVFSLFPTAVDPVASRMNYSSLMTGAVLVFAVVYYVVYARRIYKGPVVEIDLSA